MSRLLAAEGAGSIAAAGYMLQAVLLELVQGRPCLRSRGLATVLGGSAGVLFSCAVSGRCASAWATHPATVSQLNGGGCFASDHSLSPQVACSGTDSQKDKRKLGSIQKTPVLVVSSVPRADCLQDVLQEFQPEQSISGSMWCSTCPPPAIWVLFNDVGVAV